MLLCFSSSVIPCHSKISGASQKSQGTINNFLHESAPWTVRCGLGCFGHVGEKNDAGISPDSVLNIVWEPCRTSSTKSWKLKPVRLLASSEHLTLIEKCQQHHVLPQIFFPKSFGFFSQILFRLPEQRARKLLQNNQKLFVDSPFTVPCFKSLKMNLIE